jgi:transcriptional regulator with XRE-family HTH domain
MFGSFVKSLRERKGIGLRKFCRKHRLDPSNWSKIEREVLPPPMDRQALLKWAKYLGVSEESQDWRVFFEFAEKDQPNTPVVQRLIQSGAAGVLVLPPSSTRPEKLPLNEPNFSWAQFEAFARDLIGRLEGVTECFHYGTQGNKQKGIDLVAKRSDATVWVFQCKQVRKFAATDVRKAVEQTSFKASKFILFVSCEV